MSATRTIDGVGPTRILLLENIHASGQEVLRQRGYVVETRDGSLSTAELKEAVRDKHVIGIRSKTHLTAEVIAAAPELLTIGCFCIGTNQVDLVRANAAGVPVFNAPFSNTRSVAELCIAEIVCLARRLTDRTREVHTGKWRKTSAESFEVRGKILGIVGYGHIGSQVGILAEAMGMRVVYYDIATKLPIGNARPVPSLDALLAAADFVTLHVPATSATKQMIDSRALRQMKRGSYLINLSRGSVVDINALATALRERHLAGAAVDVYPEEPESNVDGFKSELQGLANVILTPHVAGSTLEAQAAIGEEVATSLVKYLASGTTSGAVNFPQVELPVSEGAHRILNVHRNVPGVLRDVNQIVSDAHANIRAQVLSTDPIVGYLIMDLERDVAADVGRALQALPTSIRTRVVY